MKRPIILHLVDDTTNGGVMRVLQHLCNDPVLAAHAQHVIEVVSRRKLSSKRFDADMLVSHLSISWARLPALFSLRSLHAKLPLIHVEHSYTEAFTALHVTQKKRFRLLLRTAYSLFNRVVAVSPTQAKWLHKRDLVPARYLSVIPSATDLSKFRTLQPTAKPRYRIGGIGRLHQQKGFDLLIEAFRQIPRPDIQLDIYGEGPERQKLENLASNDNRIHFHGNISDPVAAMGNIDILAMPSRWEAYGMVAAEGLAARRQVLVSGVDGLSDQLKNGAIKVEEFTASAWSAAMQSLLNNNAISIGLPNTPITPEEKFARGWLQLMTDCNLLSLKRDSLATDIPDFVEQR